MFSPKKTVLYSLLALMLMGSGAHALPQEESEQALPEFPKDILKIQTSNGQEIKLDIEIANTNERREFGLMFRKELPKNSGMLFIMGTDDPVRMWMKNTPLPLDMLFIDHDGIVRKIVENTPPESTKTISSDTSVIAVLEINAMMADKLGIHVGDKVLLPQEYAPHTNK